MGNIIALYTGQQVRPHDYNDSSIKGKICINTNIGTPYLVIIYDSINQQLIWSESSTTTNISTIIDYKVPDDHEVWEVLIILGDNIIYPLLSRVNIFQSIKGKHMPELCWRHWNLLAINPEVYTTRSNTDLTLDIINQRFPNLNLDVIDYFKKIDSNRAIVNTTPIEQSNV